MRVLAAIWLALILSACSPVPFDAPREVTRAAKYQSGSALHPSVSAALGTNPASSAYFELINGTDALGARLRMIEAAKSTIDISTFLIKPEPSTKIIALRLLDAADRGVRIRLLVDDIFTTATDKDLAGLAAHPNIELRIFNPAPRGGPKWTGFLTSFSRMNRRTHIKVFVVDGSMAIIGGRNFADEYYQLKHTEVFVDYDLLILGPDADDLGIAFDTYWNDDFAVPLERLFSGAPSFDPLARNTWPHDLTEIERSEYEHAVSTPYLKKISRGALAPFRGPSHLSFDRPVKLRTRYGKGPHDLANTLFTEMKRSTRQVTLITPYFVPEDYGADFFAELAQRGVRVRVVTNSLASTNHAYVHGGYARHRDQLLAAGVELYELRADALSVLQDLPEGESRLPITLHTKMAVMDSNRVFIGSLNMDPRSIRLNSEIGLFVESPAFARTILSDIETALPRFAFKVEQDDDGQLRWLYRGTGATEVHTSEPGASGWDKFLAVLPQIFGLESQT